MVSRFATAITRQASRMKSRVGVSVVYSRVGSTNETVTGWWGNEQENVDPVSGQNVRVDSTDRDFLFAATDLTLGEPLDGDRITVNGVIYELKTVQGNQPWRWSDNAQVIRRVHLKQVS